MRLHPHWFRVFLCFAVPGLPIGCGSPDAPDPSGEEATQSETPDAAFTPRNVASDDVPEPRPVDDAQNVDGPPDAEQPDSPGPNGGNQSDDDVGDGGNVADDGVETDVRDIDGGETLDADATSNTGEPADGGAAGQTQDGVAPGDASDADANAPTELAKSHDPCRHPEECTNGGDVADVWNVMTCFAPWQPRPVGSDPGPGCENQGCPDGFRCRADGSCEAITCDTAADCARDFECGTGGTCQRISCASDDDCDAFCVNGGCSQTLGLCDYQTAA